MKFSLLPVFVLSLSLSTASFAGSATWHGTGVIPAWGDAHNWEPNSVPQHPDDVATFDGSGDINCNVGCCAANNIDSIVFTLGAGKTYSITIDSGLTLNGAGIVNDSEIVQDFIVVPYGYYDRVQSIFFLNNSSAGDLVQLTATGSGEGQGYGAAIYFYDQSNAGSALINNEPSYDIYWASTNFYETASAGNASIVNEAAVPPDNKAGSTRFNDNSSAGSATIVNQGTSSSGGEGGLIYFYNDSSAGSATIVNQGAPSADGKGGVIYFEDDSNAADSTITCEASTGGADNPAEIWFDYDSDGGTSRIVLYGDGTLYTYFRSSTSLSTTVGSLEGDGHAVVSASNFGPTELDVGSNNLSTTFDGLIEEQFYEVGSEASLRKIGTGRLILTNANTYHGGTVVESGVLLANNVRAGGSATGSGGVRVSGGTFGGAGAVTGPVTIGTGNGAGAILAPGKSGIKPGTLTIENKLTLRSDATYRVTMDSRIPAADKVSCVGAAIHRAQILLNDLATNVISAGTVFTVLENTNSSSINGRFVNLPDGGTIQIGNNTYQANYEGGDGNDLTLTVVP